nr:suppressor of mec-8 and unc-52 protein homolog 2 [Ipomoea batatas]
MTTSKRNHKEKIIRRNKEEKAEEPEQPKYRDRAKERREDQNPDYVESGAYHSVRPPGSDIGADAHKLSIEKSKYLGGDVEHTHLVKGLDYALLHKVRSEIDKKPDVGDDSDGKSRASKEDQTLAFRTATAKSVYKWIVKPPSVVKTNEMFLPGRMAFIFNMETGFSHDIPTTVHRSKADCPVPEEMVTVGVDGSVLDRIAKIMSYLRLGSSGHFMGSGVLHAINMIVFFCSINMFYLSGKISGFPNGYEEENITKSDAMKNHHDKATVLPAPASSKKNHNESRAKQGPTVARAEEDDIFVGDGVDYSVPTVDPNQSPISEDMEESPRNKERPSYFSEPAYASIPSSEPPHGWQQVNGYDAVQAQAMAGVYPPEWQDYQYAEQVAYPDQYLQQNLQTYDVQTGLNIQQDPRFMTQEEKDRGLGSVFKRDDQRLQQLRERDAREKDPNFVSESYSECYPGYQEYNREIVDSDDEADLSKMDMGGRAKGRLHRWDFETEEEWATYNEQKEAMPKAAFQFGVKMQDGRKTRKQNKDQKLTNELHKINKILSRKKMEEKGDINEDDSHPGKKIRI